MILDYGHLLDIKWIKDFDWMRDGDVVGGRNWPIGRENGDGTSQSRLTENWKKEKSPNWSSSRKWLIDDSSQIDYPSGTSQHKDLKFIRFKPKLHGLDGQLWDRYDGDVTDCHESTDQRSTGLWRGPVHPTKRSEIHGRKIGQLGLTDRARTIQGSTDKCGINRPIRGISLFSKSRFLFFEIEADEKLFFSRIFNFWESFF